MPSGSQRMPAAKSRHPSVAALLATCLGERNPKNVIRVRAKEKVLVAKAREWQGPPFCPLIFCSHFGIRCFEVGHQIGGEGRILLGRDDRPRIEYVSGRTKERQRFTIFHEFAHTLFPDFCQFVPLYHGGGPVVSPEEKEFEHLCDVAAAEMLFPESEFIEDLGSLGRIGFTQVRHLRNRYEASIDATCQRLADLCNSVACSFAFLTDRRGHYPGRGPLWVRYSTANKLFKGFVAPGTVPPPGSAALKCLNGIEPIVGPTKETWLIKGSPRTYLVEATRLPVVDNPDYPKVVVILLPQGYKGGPGFQ